MQLNIGVVFRFVIRVHQPGKVLQVLSIPCSQCARENVLHYIHTSNGMAATVWKPNPTEKKLKHWFIECTRCGVAHVDFEWGIATTPNDE